MNKAPTFADSSARANQRLAQIAEVLGVPIETFFIGKNYNCKGSSPEESILLDLIREYLGRCDTEGARSFANSLHMILIDRNI